MLAAGRGNPGPAIERFGERVRRWLGAVPRLLVFLFEDAMGSLFWRNEDCHIEESNPGTFPSNTERFSGLKHPSRGGYSALSAGRHGFDAPQPEKSASCALL